MTWRTIDSAPKDGTWIFLYGGDISYSWDGDTKPPIVVGQMTSELNGRRVKEHWQFAWYDGGYYGEYENPTHWMPMTELPTNQTSDGSPCGHAQSDKT